MPKRPPIRQDQDLLRRKVKPIMSNDDTSQKDLRSVQPAAANPPRLARHFGLGVGAFSILTFHFEDGLSWPLALCAAGGAGLFAYLFMALLFPGSSGGPLAHLKGEKFRALRAALVGVLIGGLAGGGMYFHDGAPPGTALLGFAGFWVMGFVFAYVPALQWAAGILSALSR